jgi:type I restriction enzyme S subunit
MKTKWPTKKLGDICEKITDGSHFSPVSTQKGKPYITVRDISWSGKIDFKNSKRISNESYNELVKNGCKPEKGDLLYSKDGTVGKLALVNDDGDFVVLSSLAILRPTKELDQKYLYYAMQSPEFSNHALRSKTGAAIKRVVLKTIKTFEIQLPPLVEQKKIVKILEEKLVKVKEAIALRQDAIADTEKILSTKLGEIFAEGKEKGWKENRIDEIAEIKGGKRLPKGEKLIDEKTPHPYIRVTDFKGGQLRDESIKYLTEDIFNQISRYIISSNDIFVSIAGTIGLVHKIPEKFDGASLTENAAKITNINDSVSKDYLYWLLNSDWIQKELKGRSIQTTISKLALYKIGEQKIVYPDLKMQEKIVKELDELSARIAELRTLQDEQLANLKSLERAYLHEAFNGELV